MRRREFLGIFAGTATAWPLAARAQQPAARMNRRHQIGWLVFGGSNLGVIDQTLVDALAQRGLVAGRTVDVTFRHANGVQARLGELAGELVALKPDLLVGISGTIVKTLFDASRGSIPIVGGMSENPVRAQFVSSLARPDKNFTGITFITDEMAAKRIEILREAVPTVKHVAVIWNPQHLDDEMTFAKRAADSLGLQLTSHPATTVAGVDAALRSATDSGADSLFCIPSGLIALSAGRIAQYGRDQRVPVIAAWREFVDSGCLLSYGPSRAFEARRLAGYVEKILAGVKPIDLPVEQPTKFELVINLKTAKALGLQIAPMLLGRADEVIE